MERQRQTTPGIRTFYPAPRDEVRAEARRRGERWAAAASGVVEGVLEGLQRYELALEAERALAAAGDMARAVGKEVRTQARDPVLAALGHDVEGAATAAVGKTRARTQDWAHEVRDTWGEAQRAVAERIDEARTTAAETADDLRHEARWQWRKAQTLADDVWEDLRIRGRALGEAGHRASHAPRLVAKDIGQAVSARRKAMASSMALYAVAGVVGLTTFVVLTIAVVAGLSAVFGAAVGTFVAAVIYGLVAVGAIFAAKSASETGRQRAAAHMTAARRQISDIGRPLQVAFQRDLDEYK